MRNHCRTFFKRPLPRAAWNAVLTVRERHALRWEREAIGCFPVEEVERIREIFQAGQGANLRRDFTGESIVRHIQLLEMDKLGEGFWKSAGETIEAEV